MQPAGVLHGVVALGPVGGARLADQTRREPAGGVTLLFLRDGFEAASVRTDEEGAYRVKLPAGQYAVEGPQPLQPRHVVVPEEGFLRIDFAVDSKVS